MASNAISSIEPRSSISGIPIVLRSAGLIAAGCLITFPARIPNTPAGMRTTDVLGVIALLLFAATVIFGLRPGRWAAPLAITFTLSMTWIITEFFNFSSQLGVQRARMVCVRWILSLFVAYWLASLMKVRRWRGTLVLGLVIGSGLSLGSVAYDAATFNPATADEDSEAAEPVWIGDQYRAGGIFSHPNSAAGTILLSVPLLIGAVRERRLRRYAIVLPIAILVAVYGLTSTRGPTFVASCLIAGHLFGRISYRKLAIVTIVSAVFLGVVLIALQTHTLSSLPLADRLLDAANIEGGAKDRLSTTLTSIEIAFTHPLGVGSRYEQMLEQVTGFSATHNGFLQLALLGGLPLTVYVFWRLCRKITQLRSLPSIEAWTALYLVSALMFENQFFVPTFSIFTLWLICNSQPDDDEVRASGNS